MNTAVLIEAIVRQTTVLIATLATAAGQRAPLSHIADQVFGDLVRELNEQGVDHKVIADMFGIALRTYHGRVARLTTSGTDQGRSLWEAVLTHIENQGPVSRALTEAPDAPQHIVLVVRTDGEKISGSIVLGDAPPPPKATDPDAFYPPIDAKDETGVTILGAPFDGVPFTLLDARRSGSRLTFDIAPSELWTDWCALQTMTYVAMGFAPSKWTCSLWLYPPPGNTINPPHLLAKSDLCGYSSGPSVCTCDEASCHAAIDSSLWRRAFDLAVVDGILEGTARLSGGSTAFGGGQGRSSAYGCAVYSR